jgi:hypothetical protein
MIAIFCNHLGSACHLIIVRKYMFAETEKKFVKWHS